MTRFEIAVPTKEREREVWTFWYRDDRHALVLDKWERQTKATNRHKWATQEFYDRCGHGRSSSLPVGPEIPAVIRSVAIGKFLEGLQVTH